jgi:hypothetical protein
MAKHRTFENTGKTEMNWSRSVPMTLNDGKPDKLKADLSPDSLKVVVELGVLA